MEIETSLPVSIILEALNVDIDVSVRRRGAYLERRGAYLDLERRGAYLERRGDARGRVVPLEQFL